MEKPTLENVLAELQQHFGSNILAVEQDYDFHTVHISKQHIVTMLRYLYDHDTFRFQYLTTACGLHYPDAERPFGMMYQVHSLTTNLRLRFKAFTTASDLEFDTLTTVFPAANWMEREAFDFFGFHFKGHPNLKRILNVEDMDYHPLRKEYPIEDATRYDKDDTLFGRRPAGYDRKRLQP
jgi:NADH-quinone oxidoreductase subunit C